MPPRCETCAARPSARRPRHGPPPRPYPPRPVPPTLPPWPPARLAFLLLFALAGAADTRPSAPMPGPHHTGRAALFPRGAAAENAALRGLSPGYRCGAPRLPPSSLGGRARLCARLRPRATPLLPPLDGEARGTNHEHRARARCRRMSSCTTSPASMVLPSPTSSAMRQVRAGHLKRANDHQIERAAGRWAAAGRHLAQAAQVSSRLRKSIETISRGKCVHGFTCARRGGGAGPAAARCRRCGTRARTCRASGRATGLDRGRRDHEHRAHAVPEHHLLDDETRPRWSCRVPTSSAISRFTRGMRSARETGSSW
jgi:hypothetical protein